MSAPSQQPGHPPDQRAAHDLSREPAHKPSHERTQAPIRVLLVDDDPLVRAALSMVLSAAADVTVVGQAGDGHEAVKAAAATSPHVVLMDVRMPRRDGISATAEILAAVGAGNAADRPNDRSNDQPGELPGELPGKRAGDRPDRVVQVLVLTTFAEDEAVLAALRAGACGFLLKDTPPLAILEAVRQAAAGQTTISPAVVRRLVDRVLHQPAYGAPGSPGSSGVSSELDPSHGQRDERLHQARARSQQALAALSQREQDVALAVAEGCTNAEIAARLHLSATTVKAHLSRVMDKLAVSNRVQVAIAVHDARQP